MKTSRAGGFFCNKNYLCTPVRQGDPVKKPSARGQAFFIRPSSPAAQCVLNHLFSPIYLSICRIDLLSSRHTCARTHTRGALFHLSQRAIGLSETAFLFCFVLFLSRLLNFQNVPVTWCVGHMCTICLSLVWIVYFSVEKF